MYRIIGEEMEFEDLSAGFTPVNTNDKHIYGGFDYYYLPDEETYIRTNAITMFDSGAFVSPNATRYRLTRIGCYANINGVWVLQ